MNYNTDNVNIRRVEHPPPNLENNKGISIVNQIYSISIIQVYRGLLFILKVVYDPGRIVPRIKC